MLDRWLFMLPLVIFLLGLSWGEGSAVVVPVSLEKLTRQAELIAVGRVEDVESRVLQGLTFSFAILHPEKVIKGDVPSQKKIPVRFYSGISTSPVFEIGEDVVVFLRRLPRGDAYETVAAWQGKYQLRSGVVLRGQVPLAVFLQKIQEILSSDRH